MKWLVLVLMLTHASSALAADLINEDTNRYDVSLSCDGVTSHTKLQPRTVHEDAFREGCTITLSKQKRSMSVKRAGNVSVRKGKLVAS